jgi:hypothetical protein
LIPTLLCALHGVPSHIELRAHVAGHVSLNSSGAAFLIEIGAKVPIGPRHRLFAAIAVMSIVALRLLDLRELARAAPEAPAEATGLGDDEVKLLGLAPSRTLTTVASVVLALGRLGAT